MVRPDVLPLYEAGGTAPSSSTCTNNSRRHDPSCVFCSVCEKFFCTDLEKVLIDERFLERFFP